jgi:hypothetical protein
MIWETVPPNTEASKNITQLPSCPVDEKSVGRFSPKIHVDFPREFHYTKPGKREFECIIENATGFLF